VVPIEAEDVDQWLTGTPAQAAQLVRLVPVGVFRAGPAVGLA
jgi:putative SOS response-associated peptidase YedK